ncbi:MAG: TCP-1/cpn60 chaperonin family protein [Methanophagales archaeon]|nr:TCP-1/cpn60 chaperonin family protein [Methanophagales archaeon]MCW3139392.1 TCP-1/cpn60 chaperonin family protein [Methanophagales archaeon]MCW7070324.1 TCP-1/cpn60 chaperonin family protein [Methanophagales archaeon]
MIKEELPPGEVPPEEIQETNMMVCAAFSDMFKPVIGPFGSKILITQGATKVEAADLISSNAYSLIKELKYMHPTADILITAGLTQGERVGDGIATVMILIGELVRKGYELRKAGVHQNIVVDGYERALGFVKEILKEMATTVDVRDEGSIEIWRQVAKTALKKGEFCDEDILADVVVQSIRRLSNSKGEGASESERIDVDDIAIEAKSGGKVNETRFFEGVVVDREVLDALPTEVSDAKIALLDFPIEYREPKIKGRKELPTGMPARERSKAGETLGALDFHVKISKPSHFREFHETRARLFDELVDPIVRCGANVICCRWGVDDDALPKFRNAGIMVIKRVKLTDLERLERATGAKIVKDVSDLSPDKFGYAGRVLQREIGGDKYVFFENCPRKESATIVIRGTSLRVLESLVGELKSALHSVAQLFEDNRVVPGGAAVEVESAYRLRKFARGIPSKEQLAVDAFADALETIPRAIAKNCGMDQIDTLTKLRAEHFRGNMNAGISGRDKSIRDMFQVGIIEPLSVKLQAFISATEAATGMMKIDDLHIAKSAAEKEAEDIEARIAGRTKDIIEAERKPPDFKFKGGRLRYPGTREEPLKSVYRKGEPRWKPR